MPLRTRITLFLSVGLLLVVASLIALGNVRATLEQDRLAEIAINAQASLWRSLVADRTDALDAIAAALATRLPVTAPDLSPEAVSDAIAAAPDLVTADLTVQVLALDGELIASTAPVFRSRPLLGLSAIDALLSDTSSVAGLRQERPESYVVAAARAVSVRGEPRAVLSVSVDAAVVLASLAERIGDPAYLVSLRGRMVEGTDPALWAAAAPELPLRTAAAALSDVGDRIYFAASVPVEDLMGGLAGTLVTLRDATDSIGASRRIERLGLAAVGVVSLLVVGALHLFLRQAFRPLEGAIATLDALSKGRLDLQPLETGTGEIGRIGEALTVFRRNAQRLQDQEETIARQRRRQERVIRRQIERLAQTLDPEGRTEILADLGGFVAGRDPAGAAGPNEELAYLAEVLRRMSQRIADQHRRLTELIADLRDAIVTRARLAGLEQELEIARDLQLSFLPKPLPPQPAFAVHGLMETAKEVGGDFYDYFMIDDRRLGIVVADVSGKGVAAALFMAITRTLVKATAMTAPTPSATIDEVNAFLAAENDQMMFVTLFHGVLDLETGQLDYVNAGHNPPLLVTGNGAVNPLARSGDPAIAVVEGFGFKRMTARLSPGDVLVLYTDGVTEAFDPSGAAFGEERLERVVAELRNAPVAEVANAVRDAVLAFEDGAERADDLTCLALSYRS